MESTGESIRRPEAKRKAESGAGGWKKAARRVLGQQGKIGELENASKEKHKVKG